MGKRERQEDAEWDTGTQRQTKVEGKRRNSIIERDK